MEFSLVYSVQEFAALIGLLSQLIDGEGGVISAEDVLRLKALEDKLIAAFAKERERAQIKASES